ncbi:hypothetical protein BVRB_8g189790 [Beta vulgaris subsp. vulgaris]|nr:hypothetical protein BVRB_8g189790 [Beta vulgaris subsp. vulgaris]
MTDSHPKMNEITRLNQNIKGKPRSEKPSLKFQFEFER